METIFTGISILTLDDKNRFFLPQKFRIKEKKYVFTFGVDPCIVIYPYSGWKSVVKKIDTLSIKNKTYQRVFLRAFFSEAEIVDMDTQGRILIPQKFIKKYRLSTEIVLVGNRNKIELWAKNVWTKYHKHAEKIINKIKSQIEI